MEPGTHRPDVSTAPTSRSSDAQSKAGSGLDVSAGTLCPTAHPCGVVAGRGSDCRTRMAAPDIQRCFCFLTQPPSIIYGQNISVELGYMREIQSRGWKKNEAAGDQSL